MYSFEAVSILGLDPDISLDSQRGSSNPESVRAPPLKDDPEYVKYFKMVKMKLF